MIPAYSHCQDCGNAATLVQPLWGGVPYWWCRVCKALLTVAP